MTLHKSLLAGFSVLAFAAASATAAEEAKDKGADKASPPPAAAGATAQQQSFVSLDTNKDGSIARAEIAAHAELASKFKDADKDDDGKLSQSEYDSMSAGGSTAAGAGSTRK